MGLVGTFSLASELGCLNVFRGWSVLLPPLSAVSSQELELEMERSLQVTVAQPLRTVRALYSALLLPEKTEKDVVPTTSSMSNLVPSTAENIISLIFLSKQSLNKHSQGLRGWG